MSYIPPVTTAELKPHVERFYGFLQLWFALGMMLVLIGVALPMLLHDKRLWAIGAYLVAGATIERSMFDIKRHANLHNRVVSHEALQFYAIALRIEKWFANCGWLIGTGVGVAAYLSH